MFLGNSLPQKDEYLSFKQAVMTQLLAHPRPLAVQCIKCICSIRLWPKGRPGLRVSNVRYYGHKHLQDVKKEYPVDCVGYCNHLLNFYIPQRMFFFLIAFVLC